MCVKTFNCVMSGKLRPVCVEGAEGRKCQRLICGYHGSKSFLDYLSASTRNPPVISRRKNLVEAQL